MLSVIVGYFRRIGLNAEFEIAGCAGCMWIIPPHFWPDCGILRAGDNGKGVGYWIISKMNWHMMGFELCMCWILVDCFRRIGMTLLSL